MNLFRKLLSNKPSDTYSKDIATIHNEFETAGEKLLQESIQILKDCSLKDVDKGKRLKELGFTSTPQSVEVEETLIKRENAEQTANTVKDYSIKYPNNKFITEDMVVTICKKYGLVCGDLHRFKGFVPEVKLKDIEAFKKASKIPKIGKLTPYPKPYNGDIDLSVRNINLDEFIEKKDGHYYHLNRPGKSELQQNIEDYDGVNWYGTVNIDGAKIQCNLEIVGLKICAPLKEMNTEGMELDGIHLIKQIPDPVVLQPIEGGYLVVTAWGDEASDPLVVNEKHN